MNVNHKIYSGLLQELYDERHIFKTKITEEYFIRELKRLNIYEWYIKQQRKKKLLKIENEKN